MGPDHNILSWYIRPQFLLPFWLLAYRHSLLGIGLTLARPRDQHGVVRGPSGPEPGCDRDAGRRTRLLVRPVHRPQGVGDLADPGHLHCARSGVLATVVGLGLVVINGAVLFKIGWSYAVSGTAGANAHLVRALTGLVLVDGLLLPAARVLAHRRSQGSPACVG